MPKKKFLKGFKGLKVVGKDFTKGKGASPKPKKKKSLLKRIKKALTPKKKSKFKF